MKISKAVAASALVGASVVGGAIGASMIGTASASTTPTASSSAAPAPQSDPMRGGPGGRPGRGLDLSGTVTAVGTNSVTIKTASGVVQYTVSSASDIDKNGEATLSSLVVGDAVRFNVDSTNSKQIDKLHAGDETKDMPQGPPPGASGPSTSSAA